MLRLTQPLLPPIPALTDRIKEIWDEAWLTNRGHQLIELEGKLREVVGCENLSLFCNGTVALLLGLKALDLKGEIVTTPFTFPATTHAIDWAGLTPVFADVDPLTLTLDPERIQEAITERTTAILAVHVYGIPCAVERIAEIARQHRLKVIYDAAHAFGTEIRGVPIGQFGDMSMFSFHATKLFHTLEGGGLVYSDPALKQKLHLLHNFGIQDEDTVVMSGINGKMNELQAAVGLCVLEMLEEERAKRAAILECYQFHLADIAGLKLFLPEDHVRPSYQYLPLLVTQSFGETRDEIFLRLRAHGILARRYFRPLCSSYDCYRHLPSASPSNLPVASAAEKEVLCLPFFGGLSLTQVKEICTLICQKSKS